MQQLQIWWNNTSAWWADILQGSDVLTAIATLAWIDWIVIFGLLLGFLWGVKQGFMRMIVEVAELLLLIFLVMITFKNLASYLATVFGQRAASFAEPLAFMITTSIVFLAIVFIDSFLKKMMHTEVVAPLKILGGAFLGWIHAILFLGLLVQGILVWPFYNLKKVFEPGGSVLGVHMIHVVPTAFDLMTDPTHAFDRFKKKK